MSSITETFFISFAARSGYSNRHDTGSVVAGPDGRVTVTISDVVEETRNRNKLMDDNGDIRIFHGSFKERVKDALRLFNDPHAQYTLYFEINLGDPNGWALLDGLNGYYYTISLKEPNLTTTIEGLPKDARLRAVVLRWAGRDVIESLKVSLTCTTH